MPVSVLELDILLKIPNGGTKQSVEKLNLGLSNTNPSSCKEEDLNLGPPDNKSSIHFLLQGHVAVTYS